MNESLFDLDFGPLPHDVRPTQTQHLARPNTRCGDQYDHCVFRLLKLLQNLQLRSSVRELGSYVRVAAYFDEVTDTPQGSSQSRA